MEPLYELALLEHPDGGAAGVVVVEIEVDEGEAVEVVLVRGGYRVAGEPEGVVVARRRVVAQALQGDLLLGHQLAGRLVHLGVVDTEAAEYREGLEYRDVRVSERAAVVLPFPKDRKRVCKNFRKKNQNNIFFFFQNTQKIN